ncbi:ribosomal protein S18-alanine N-acetyltransferase [Geomonas sp. Red69]|uniref:[Ribosomal protein bS18]-alanine N-acetyltransferase n=1 Tax=Geomonas diazotrophica TaxID=2843197 RepID=A0ABX8JSM0_9BACT|nr:MULTISPECIES: ribosomal protein S18-alanine N-acetyltransferase [Geomonas]MBU5637310.1 ribosomal protein S18-alanine N-acetyltransferase [Geomonas diazotrophica]QWV99597.1 ribosomal protein S18-alanine N-acetyltransferase [Geomonas nitrogeniifigens]
MCDEDLDSVLEIESASFPRPWTRRHFLDEMESPGSHPVVAVTGAGKVAGYLCLKQVLDEAEILDVAVDPGARGGGIGRALVDWAVAFCRQRKLALLCLEVRVGNHEAISLYRRLGFAEVGRRRNYYENGDDAILMDLSIAQVEECDAV